VRSETEIRAKIMEIEGWIGQYPKNIPPESPLNQTIATHRDRIAILKWVLGEG